MIAQLLTRLDPAPVLTGTDAAPEPFNRERAGQLLDAANRAYVAGPEGTHLTDPQLGHLGTVFETETEVIVAYRGSIIPRSSHTRHQLKASLHDWLGVNFDTVLVHALGGRVHRGWLDRLDRTWQQVWRLVGGQSDRRSLWITGHSMGGAVSILAGQRFVESGRMPAGVYAFGAPKVGDFHFKSRYRAPLFCVENRHDLVPWLPLSRWVCDVLARGPVRATVACCLRDADFVKVGEEWWISPGGELRPPTWKDRYVYRLAALAAHPARLIPDHWIEEYQTILGSKPLPALESS